MNATDTLAGNAPLGMAQRAPVAGSWEAVAQAYAVARTQRDAASIDLALKKIGAWLAAHADDGRALVYQGSLLTLRARASVLPWKKLSMLQDGVGRMERGVARVMNDPAQAGGPLELEVRVVRGTTSARIPRVFGRGNSARADLRAVIANPMFGHLQPATRAGALGWMAVLSERDGNAEVAEALLAQARAADVRTANAVWGDDQ
jgi:hypothetical protein